MNANEFIYIKTFFAHTTEDDFNKGEIGNTMCAWSYDDIPVKGNFKTIPEALKAVCEANCYDFNLSGWYNMSDCGDVGRFDCSWLVDAENTQATESELTQWRAGNKRLWSCNISVYLGVRTERELTTEECDIENL